jgi:hypothetical protein
MAETTQQRRDRMYQEAVMAKQAQQQAAQVASQPSQTQDQAVIQPNFQPPPQPQNLAPADLLRLRQPYMEYVTAEQVAGRQPKEIGQWAIDMSQGR